MAKQWWESRWFAAFLVILSVVPLLYPEFPPMVDLPSHMARYKIALGDSELLARYYDFRWQLSGNLGADLLVVPLAALIGPEAATKFIAVLIPPLTIGALISVSHAVHGRLSPALAMAVPLTYTQPYLYGFLNYVLAVALALWAFLLFYRLGQSGRLKARALLMIPIGLGLFFTHASGWGILGLSAFASEWVRYRKSGANAIAASWSAGVQMAPLALPLLLILVWQSGAAGDTSRWFDWHRKMVWASVMFRDLWLDADRLTALFMAIFLAAALIFRSFKFDQSLGLAALTLLAAVICLPFVLFGSALTDARLMPVALMLALAAIRPFGPDSHRLAKAVAVISVSFAIVRIAVTTAAFAYADHKLRDQLAVLDRMDRGARVAVAVGGRCSFWPLPRNDHLGSMAILRKEAFVNDQWYLPGSVSLIVDYPEAGSYAADPSQFLPYSDCGPKALQSWMDGLPADAFDHLWLLQTRPLPEAYRHQWRLVAAREDSLLYRKVSPDQAGRVSTQP